MSYLNEMNEAIARAARLQLKTPIFKPQKGLFIERQLSWPVQRQLPWPVDADIST